MKKKLYTILSVTSALLLAGTTACAAIDGMDDTSSPADFTEESTSQTTDVPPMPEFSTSQEENEEENEQTTLPEEEGTPAVSAPTPVQKTTYIQILTDNLNVRKAASASSASLGQVDRGVSMAYLGKEGSFYKTYYKNTVAYVSAKAAYTATYETLSASEKIEKIVEEGTKLIGTPYVYGAVRYHDGNGNTNSSFTVAKFDCSSLTQYIFYKGASRLLQVTTRTQIYQGTHVEKSDLQRGDLIFFTNSSRYNNKGIERVGHVALYLGDNRILHTASDYCKIEEISATRWSYYIEARRMV
jgi:cell wall-associated NlpC family hydrolase